MLKLDYRVHSSRRWHHLTEEAESHLVHHNIFTEAEINEFKHSLLFFLNNQIKTWVKILNWFVKQLYHLACEAQFK